MKKIRILTFWNVPNYGGFLQAYALQRALENRYKNCDVKQIPYLQKKHYDVYYSYINNNYRLWAINPKFYRSLLGVGKRRKQVKTTREFLKYYKFIPSDETANIDTLSCDYLVIGSDIVWDYSIDFIKDKYLFGIGIDAKHKISYAPSFGTVLSGANAPGFVNDGLNELEAISVRDEKSKRIVEEICGKNATVVLDPTLIWNFQMDENILKPSEEHYIIVYGSFFTDELIIGAKEYCKNNDLRLICLSSLDEKYDWVDKIIDQDKLTPFEWAGYFKHADAVMTCTYHGLLFGLIFKKKIVFNPTDFIMSKAESFIDYLDLNDVLVKYGTFAKKINWNWDYKIIDERLNEIRKESYDYLDGAIK